MLHFNENKDFEFFPQMNLHGKVIVIKRTGADGACFPLTVDRCLFGRFVLLPLVYVLFGLLLM